MESAIIGIIGIILVLLALTLIFKGLGFVLKILTNPKVLLIALVVCVAVLLVSKMMS